jgi:hypothetical protein
MQNRQSAAKFQFQCRVTEAFFAFQDWLSGQVTNLPQYRQKQIPEIPFNDQKSFTKIISNMVMARNTSIE